MDDPTLSSHVDRIKRVGFTIVEDAIEPALISQLTETLNRLERDLSVKPAGNAFEGAHTVRIYNLLAYGSPFDSVPVHRNVLPVVEAILGQECLVSSLSSIAIDPGEKAQPIHSDDMAIPLEKPHVPIVCNSMWALTDFTEANGATRIVPGSHRKPSPEYGGHYDSIPAEMRAGSVLIWEGALWHGGGANRTSMRRTGLAMNYCAGFIRQQENQLLGVPADIARTYTRRLQALMGYEPYRGLIGHIDKRSPAQMLNGEGCFKSIWDR